jgi:SPP1 family predicted phage head-tail adaptor
MIGGLKHPLRLQRALSTPDGGGGFAVTWADVEEYPDVFARIRTVSAREDFRHLRLQAMVTHRLTIRYRSDVAADMRLVDGEGRIFDIVGVVDVDMRREFLDILAVSQG